MARMHGKDARVYLGSRDISGDINNVAPEFSAATHDTTRFSSGGWSEADAGLLSWDVKIDGWHDPVAGGFGRQLESLLGAAGGLLSIYEDRADAIGDNGILFPDAILEQRSQPVKVDELIKLSGSFKPASAGRVGFLAKLLHVLGAEAATGNGASVNNAAASANGGRANLHITATTGTGGTVKVQHSADNTTFADLITFTAAAAATSETREVSGTVNQYIRANHTINASSSLTYVLGFARY